jgi:hypothetical protein
LSGTGDDDAAYLPSFHVGHSFVGVNAGSVDPDQRVTVPRPGSGIKARQVMPASFWEAGLPA